MFGSSSRRDEVSDAFELVKGYVKQETIEPIKGAGRFIGLGVAGALLLGIGLVLLLVGLLRVLQTETGDVFDGNWTFVPYVITLVVCFGLIGITASRINKGTLQKKEPSR
ncbi:MAG TPA: hypothetical protein VF855_02010 [Acidimicrobiales bacterium]